MKKAFVKLFLSIIQMNFRSSIRIALIGSVSLTGFSGWTKTGAADIDRGKSLLINYPSTGDGVSFPIQATDNLMKLTGANTRPSDDLVDNLFNSVADAAIRSKMLNDYPFLKDIHSIEDLWAWMGLGWYYPAKQTGPFAFPKSVANSLKKYPVGIAEESRSGARTFTVTCAACHADNLFGTAVLGLGRKLPKSNIGLYMIKGITTDIEVNDFSYAAHATANEASAYMEAQKRLMFTSAGMPTTATVDPSFANIALTLEKYFGDDGFPPLSKMWDRTEADTKPPALWNIKYKDKFLVDGAVTAGNPVLVFWLWNELIRGTKMNDFGDYVKKNPQDLADMTAAVNSLEAPRMTDFFSASAIDLASAKRGQGLFNNNCARCHGTYEKAWDGRDTKLSAADLLKTTKVNYTTKIMDVGTDSDRYILGADLVERTNSIQVAKDNGIKIAAQKGYVVPPLVGIWARWPYFHNNSAQSLCAVLTRSEDRPKFYYAGEAEDKDADFDSKCNGYPLADKVRSKWKDVIYKFESNQPGMSKKGHDEGIFLKNGAEIYTPAQKYDIIQFLQTL